MNRIALISNLRSFEPVFPQSSQYSLAETCALLGMVVLLTACLLLVLKEFPLLRPIYALLRPNIQ